MGCLYLHIGTPKTGTSSIQYFLVQNRELLAEKGYCFPDLYHFKKVAKGKNGHFLIQYYYDEQKQRIREKEDAFRKEGMERVLACFDEYDNVILSDEGVWNHSHWINDFWKTLTQTVTEHGHTIKVIVYLRRQDAYLRSYWAQYVKAINLKKDFVTYIDTDPPIHADYLSTLDWIASFVGQENIIVRPFERGQLLDQFLYTDFLDCLGLPLTDEYNCTDQNKNDTVAGDYIKIKQILNTNPAFGVRKGFMVPLMESATAKRDEKPDYRRAALFPDNDPEQYLEKFKEGNETIARKYLNREDGVLFFDSSKDEKDMEPYSTEELVMACGDIILELKNKLDQTVESQKTIGEQLKNMKRLTKRKVKQIIKGKK